MNSEQNDIILDEWNFRLTRALILVEKGGDCAMCGGTGAWPALGKLKICVPCGGTGESSYLDKVLER
jgi:DnaJ-class molecular chaperone